MSQAVEEEAVQGASGIADVIHNLEGQKSQPSPNAGGGAADVSYLPRVDRSTDAQDRADAEDRAEVREEAEERVHALYGADNGTSKATREQESPGSQAAPAASQPRREAAATPDRGSESSQSSPMWSNEDVELFTQMQSESRNFQTDLQAFAKAKAQIQRLAKANPEQAKQLAPKLKAAEQELRVRYGALQKGASFVVGRLQKHQHGQTMAHLQAENQKLAASFPDLDRSALVGYLGKLGFSQEEIGTTDDHRIITLAEKARRYDALQRSRKLTIPMRKRTGQPSKQQKPTGESGNLLADIQRKYYDPNRDGPPSTGPKANGFQKRAAVDAMYPQSAPSLLMPQQPPLERLRLLYSGR